MVKLMLNISEELDKEFREKVFEKYGIKRGNIKKAAEEALTQWIEKNK